MEREPGPTLAPVAWILLSCLSFASLASLVKTVSADASVAEILLARNLPSVIVLGAFALARGQSLRTAHGRLHLQRCLFGVAAMALGVHAVRHLPLATASTLEYTAPLFLVAGHLLWRRGHVRALETATVLLGFGGVLLLLRPTLDAHRTMPFLAGLLGGLLGAATYRSLRLLGEAGEPGWRIVFLYAVAGTVGGLVALPFAPLSQRGFETPGPLLGIGILGLLAQWTMTMAFRSGPTGLLASIQYATVVMSAAYGALFWGEKPSTAGLAGLTLILVSGAFAARGIARPGDTRRTGRR